MRAKTTHNLTAKRGKSNRITVYIDPLIIEFLASDIIFNGVSGSLSDAIRNITITHPLWQDFIKSKKPAAHPLPVVPAERDRQPDPPVEINARIQHPPYYAEHEAHPPDWIQMEYPRDSGRVVWVDPDYPFPGGEAPSYDEAHTGIGEQIYSEDDLEEDPPGTYDKTYDKTYDNP